MHTQFWWVNMTRIYHLEDLSIDESIHNMKMSPKGIGMGGVNWIQAALNGYTWQDVIQTLMKLQVPRNSENFLKRRSCQYFEKDFFRGICCVLVCAYVCVCVRACTKGLFPAFLIV
jgi:hypothetical protein